MVGLNRRNYCVDQWDIILEEVKARSICSLQTILEQLKEIDEIMNLIQLQQTIVV